MRAPLVFRTASFRLAAFYALIFGASVVALASAFYFTATAALNEEMHESVRSEFALLRAAYLVGGLPRMIDAIHTREHVRGAGDFDYSVYDSNGRLLYAGDTRLALQPGWSDVVAPPDRDDPPNEMEHLIVFGRALPKGYFLLVGGDVGRIEQFGHAIVATSGWILLLTITLAIGGGFALSLTFLGRIDSITRTAEAIIGGDVHRRIPLRGTADDIDRLAATLNRMLDRIGSLMDALRQVSNDIAHDLRTPLGRLRQTLDEVRRGAGTRIEYEAAVDRAVAETDAILETFAALLRIAQIEAGTRISGFRVVNLSELVASLGQTYAPVAEDTGKTFEAHIAVDLAIEGDRELLTQMLANLIDNAIRHTPNGAAITIALVGGGKGPLLTVSDNGPGIPEAERARVFERFYRLEQSRTTAGSGLGLSLVAAIAELHKAKIALADNHPGVLFSIEFPSYSTSEAPESDSIAGSRSAPRIEAPTAISPLAVPIS